MKTNKGFTLVEILIVCVIVGLLAAMFIPLMGKLRYSSLEKAQARGEKLTKDQIQWMETFKKNNTAPSNKTTVVTEESNNTFKIDTITVDGREYYLIPYSASYDTVDIKGKRFLTVPVKQ